MKKSYTSFIYRSITLLIGLILLWSLIAWLLKLPSFILPTPTEVFHSLWLNKALIWQNFLPTLFETLLGLALGTLFGISIALLMMGLKLAEFWLRPILLISQALPTFAIAPLFVIWFGYGEASKVATAVLMIFSPLLLTFLMV
nr:ABC transporter permease subunit [Piscirickettsia litoralis]